MSDAMTRTTLTVSDVMRSTSTVSDVMRLTLMVSDVMMGDFDGE